MTMAIAGEGSAHTETLQKRGVCSILAAILQHLRRMTSYSMNAVPRMSGVGKDPFHTFTSIYWISTVTHPITPSIR